MSLSRRSFCADIGSGALVASLGTTLCADLGLGALAAEERAKELTFGKLEPLVCLLQETSPDKVLPIVIEKLQKGMELRELTAAAALANARTFGGEDYVGFHTMMALAPSYHMALEMPAEQRALPVLKVLFRNSQRTKEKGGRKDEVLKHVEIQPLRKGEKASEQIVAAVRAKQMDRAEAVFASVTTEGPDAAVDHLLEAVQENLDVHRIVLPYRAWDLLPVVGKEHAHTMLRQSVRYCVHNENPNVRAHQAAVRKALPELLEIALKPRERLRTPTTDKKWVEALSKTIFESKPADGARAVADALALGCSPEAIGEAITLAANQLVLRDNGRPKDWTSPNKPEGSVHGDSVGVHGCDTANAWRNLSRIAGPRNKAACLILAAWNVARDRLQRPELLTWQPYPRAEAREMVKSTEAKKLLEMTEDAIKNKDQALASAAAAAYGAAGHAPRAMFDLLLQYNISQDGALHAEKFYRTTVEEYNIARPSFKWRYVIALARVTASAYGWSAPGMAEAAKLIKT